MEAEETALLGEKPLTLQPASEIMAEQMEQEKVMRGKTVLVLPLLLLAVSCGKAETASSAGTLKAGTSSGDYAPAGSALERTASADPVLENTVSADSTIASTASAGAATADAAVSAEERKEQERDHCEEQIKEEESAYGGLVEFYSSLVRDPSSYEEDEKAAAGVLETAHSLGDNAATEMGYWIEDLSGDGIPEMAVGMLSGPVNAVYTLEAGKPVLVFEGWYRNTYIYMGDGRFYNSASAGASSSGSGVFYLSEDGKKLLCDSFLFTALDEDGKLEVYANETGSWDPEKSERTDMTIEDFWALDLKGEPMPLIPFSETH